MDRLYKALMWLAGVALVAGLIKVILLWTLTINSLAQNSALFLADGFFSVFLTVLSAGRVEAFMNATNLLVGGVTVITLIIAGVDRRRGWLIALIVATILAVFWPFVVEEWIVRALPMSSPANASFTPPTVIVNDTLYAIPLIPVVMALILALTKRHTSAAPSAQGVAIQPQ